VCILGDKISEMQPEGRSNWLKPGALARYFAKRWLIEPSAKGEQLIAWLLEAALGRNVLYFIEKTKEYVDAWGGSREIVPVDAFDGFVITGDPVEDAIIPHAILVWTCMNDRPWEEEIYHRWLDSLLAAGSKEAAYLAASLWPAHDLMAKVTYRPAGWLVYRGQLDAQAERLILMEMLKGEYGPRTSLYGSFGYDDVRSPQKLPKNYIERHGFTHPICGLVEPIELERDSGLKKHIREALAAPSWSEGMKGAAMLLYLSLKLFNRLRLSSSLKELINILEQNLFKLDETYINIINFHMYKIEKIDYNLMKDYINYLIILYNKVINEISFSTKIFSKYMSIGIKTSDVFYIGRYLKYIIFDLTIKEKEKVESWLKNQGDDLRIKDILLATYMNERNGYVMVDEELKTEQVEKKIEDIYGKIKYFDKIRLFIDQARIYFEPGRYSYKIYDFIENILKREARINFNCNFKEDYEKIIRSWHPNRKSFVAASEDMFLDSNHIGLYLYYNILKEWIKIMLDFRYYINDEKELNLYLHTKKKIIENLYIIDNAEMKLNFYLNKIESNNFPCEKIKHKLIKGLINITNNNYNTISEYLKDKNKFIRVRKILLSNIELLGDEFRNSRLIELLGIDNKSKNMIIY